MLGIRRAATIAGDEDFVSGSEHRGEGPANSRDLEGEFLGYAGMEG
jgi:hypothetical protein